MWIAVWIAVVVLGLVGTAGLLTVATAQRVRQSSRFFRRPFDEAPPRIIGSRQVALLDIAADLKVYPDRLAQLERRLVERHAEVQRQMQRLHDGRAALADKPDREDLAKRYSDDLAALEKRADSMRRVAGVVWRTRTLLLYRVHVAGTARRRPRLANLPSAAQARKDLAGAAAAYREAAAQVRIYVDAIDDRVRQIDGVVPAEPLSAEIDDAMRKDVADERAACLEAHQLLRTKMDRLADDLTWSADHFAAMRVMDADASPALGGVPDRLVDELSKAMAGVDKLTAVIDPKVADAAMSGLTEDIGRLEQAGLDARAEADARLEVERLVGAVGT